MKMRSKLGPAVLAAACCLLGAAAALARPLDGGSYRGHTTSATPVSFRVARDGRRLASYRFVASTRCDNGESGTVVFRTARDAPVIRIRRSGFSVSFHARSAIFDRRTNRQLAGTYSDAVTGRFGSRRSASGTVRIRFRSRDGRLRCDSGKLRYTARA
jgi:hypothetical protein